MFSLESFLNSLEAFLDKAGYKIILAVFAAVFGIMVIRNLLKIAKLLLVKSSIDNSLIHFCLTISKIVLVVMLAFYCLSAVGVSLTGFVAVLSALTLAIGLAIQDIIGGVANGLMLVSTKPFKVNDYVQIGSISGTVKEITLLHTVLFTIDNKRVMLPNKTVFSSDITNYSYNPSRRVDILFGVDYDSDVETVKKLITKVCVAHPLVIKDPAPFVRLSAQADSSLNFTCRVWCNSEDYWTVYFDLMEQVYDAFVKNNINVPFPQVTLSYRKGEEAKV